MTAGITTITTMPAESAAMTANNNDTTAPELLAAAQNVLLHGLDLLSQLSDRQYSQRARAPFNASIGGHFRHVLEHFHCLIEGRSAGEVNYDARRRNPRIENEVTFASIAACDVVRAIRKWNADALETACKMVSSVAYSSGPPPLLDSNIGRELSYCVAHAIHHYAIIRLICNEAGVEVPREFGYAPWTLKNQASLSAD